MDGVPCNGFARWNGTSWTALPQIVNNYEGDCIVYDDGSGPAIYATWRPAGSFSGLNKWDGKHWTHIGHPTAVVGLASYHHLQVFDDGRGPALYLVGAFEDFNNVFAHSIIRWD